MGTRHLICVVKNNEYKVAQYGQWDGYPSGQGIDILSFLSEDPGNLNALEQGLGNAYEPTEQQVTDMYAQVGFNVKESGGWIDYDKSKQFSKLYPSLSRDTGSDILKLVATSEEPVPLNLSVEFAKDSLFCEYAYVVDFDKRTFEVYGGFNQEPIDKSERFYCGEESNDGGYWPVRFLKSWSLDALPNQDDFVNELDKEEEDAEV